MKTWARLDQDDRVIEIFSFHTDPTHLFNPSWTWVECPPGTKQHAVLNGAVFENPDEPEPVDPPTPIEASRDVKIAQVTAKVAERLAAGRTILHEGQILRIDMDDGSRADLIGMATTAIAAASGSLPWPDSYAQGWITRENVRVPLVTPDDGLMLAAQVGDYYACIRQNGRNLKDAALAAEDQAALDAVDVEAGWP